jgi:acetyl-CoA synthetase
MVATLRYSRADFRMCEMPWEPIIKSSPRGGVAPNLRIYEQARAAFSREEARSELDGLPGGGGLDIAHEAVDRHAAGAFHDKTAIRWLGKDGSVRDFSFAQRRNVSGRSGSVIAGAGKVMTKDEIKIPSCASSAGLRRRQI